MKQYLDLLQHVKDKGIEKTDRTGVGTKSCFGYQMRVDLTKGFPLLTTKKVFLKGITHELLWFLSGSTNIKYLIENGVGIWNEWPFQTYLKTNKLESEFPAYSKKWDIEFEKFTEKIKTDNEFANKWGDLGPVYGKQWIKWESEDGPINQIDDAINLIKNNPDSRRIIVSGWNVGDIQDILKGKFIAPPPCHTLFQFYVINNKLSCQLYQRSADVFLGVPFNIASYALLVMMIAQVCNLELGEFIHTFGDVHIYKNHYNQVNEQLSRTPRELPQMKLNPKIKNIYNFKYEDFELKNYDPQAPIKAPIAV